MNHLTHTHHTLLPQEDLDKPSSFPSPSLTSYSNSPPMAHQPFIHPQYEEHLIKDSYHKRNIRILKLFVRLLTLGLATYGLVSQALTLNKYLTTRNIIRENRNPWAAGTYLWPTIVLLSVSALTVLTSLLTIASYCFSGVGMANKFSTRAGLPASILEHVAHLAIWIATAVAYKLGKTGKDLWGWSCDPKALEIQHVFPEVPFEAFCNVQTGSWGVSIAEVLLVAGTVGVWTYAWRREQRRKRVRRTMEKGGFEGWRAPGV